jgi:hypothetical protein
MALGTNHIYVDLATGQGPVSAASRTRSNSAFIRELWSDEILAAYKANHVMAPLVVTMGHEKRKGDTIHVPRPIRGSASEKAEETQVTLIAGQATQSAYLIDQHWEYSRLIEDIITIQADDNLRPFYTNDAGYALSTRVDTDLHAEGAKFAGADAAPTVEGSAYSKAVIGTPSGSVLVAWDPAASLNAGNAATITDEGVRLLVQSLDDNNVPSMGRVLVVPPVEKRKMLGIDRQIVFDQVGEAGRSNAIRNGYVGPLYGAEVFVSTNCANVTADDLSTDQKAALFFQKESLLLIEQMAPRSQTQYKQEWLGDLFTADILFGTGVLRPEGGIAVVVPE